MIKASEIFVFMANMLEVRPCTVLIVFIFINFRLGADRCSAFQNQCVEEKTVEYAWDADSRVPNTKTVFLQVGGGVRVPACACAL